MSSSETDKEHVNIDLVPILVDWYRWKELKYQQYFVGMQFLGLQLLVLLRVDDFYPCVLSLTVPDAKAVVHLELPKKKKKKSRGAYVANQGCCQSQGLVSQSLNFRIFAFWNSQEAYFPLLHFSSTRRSCQHLKCSGTWQPFFLFLC